MKTPLSILTCQGRTIATYSSAAFIPARLAHRRPPLVVSLLIGLLCALALTLMCLLIMHPVNGEASTSPTTQSGESLGTLIDQYDP